MIILKESGSDQTFKIIPRELEATTMTLTNETTGVSTSYDITPTILDYYLQITKTVTLQEGNFYMLTVKNGADIVYKDKVFCTNQTLSDYSVNNNEYTNYTSNNDYITYE